MKRRYLLLVIILIFGVAFWFLMKMLDSHIPPAVQTPTATKTVPEVPAAVQPVPDNEIIVSSPTSGEAIISPFTVTGQARGNWFFEGVFPVALTNLNGTTIATGAAHAQGEWTTTNFVPFVGTLTFVRDNSAPGPHYGYIVFKKDNESGDARFDKSMSIKVQW